MSAINLWRINGLLYKGKTAHDACVANAHAEFSTARIELVKRDVGKATIEELLLAIGLKEESVK